MSYDRRLKLNLGGLVLDSALGMRVTFDVKRDKSREPNDAVIEVYNLAESTRKQLETQKRAYCELSAGYSDESVHRIFSGVLLDAQTQRSGANLVTTCSLGDDAAQAAAITRLNRTFPQGTPIGTVLRELIKTMGLGSGNLEAFASSARLSGQTSLPRAWPVNGSAPNALNDLARSLGWQYTIQNREVRFLGQELASTGGPVITSENAEAPTRDAEGTISFSCRLLPDLIPGSPMRMDMRSVKGVYVAIQTRHHGDTHGTDWSVDVQADPIERIIAKGLRVNA